MFHDHPDLTGGPACFPGLIGANGKLAFFCKGAPAPPKQPKIKMPKMKMPKMKMPHFSAPPIPPPEPPAPNQVNTSDMAQASSDASAQEQRKQGLRSTLFAGENAYKSTLGGVGGREASAQKKTLG